MSEVEAVFVPQMNPNDEHAVLVRWHVTSGERVSEGQVLATMETTKATFELNAPREGYAFFREPERSMLAVGAQIVWISQTPQPPDFDASANLTETAVVPVLNNAAPTGITRKALRLMEQHGLTTADFPGLTRIESAHVEARIKRSQAAPGTKSATHPPAPAPEGMEPLDQPPSKALEVARLTEVYQSAIPSAVSISVSSERVNARLAAASAKSGGPVSLLELAIFESARVLEDFPELNGWYSNGRAWHYKHVAVGFAVNLGRSLRVPVVHVTADGSVLDVARSVRDLTLRYMRNELSTADVSGGTFTITDLSTHNVVTFIPVLNGGQSAILGICAERPGTGHRELVLSFDHRMSDGMRAATFLGALAERLTTLEQD
jgi:pyruvate/2-oxoglutarate dehydrogenase complex dihydrolipoamide acyltransferase (E2) component